MNNLVKSISNISIKGFCEPGDEVYIERIVNDDLSSYHVYNTDKKLCIRESQLLHILKKETGPKTIHDLFTFKEKVIFKNNPIKIGDKVLYITAYYSAQIKSVMYVGEMTVDGIYFQKTTSSNGLLDMTTKNYQYNCESADYTYLILPYNKEVINSIPYLNTINKEIDFDLVDKTFEKLTSKIFVVK